jgi:hypothetical protein
MDDHETYKTFQARIRQLSKYIKPDKAAVNEEHLKKVRLDRFERFVMEENGIEGLDRIRNPHALNALKK